MHRAVFLSHRLEIPPTYLDMQHDCEILFMFTQERDLSFSCNISLATLVLYLSDLLVRLGSSFFCYNLCYGMVVFLEVSNVQKVV